MCSQHVDGNFSSLACKFDGFLGAGGEVVGEECLHTALLDDLHASFHVCACAKDPTRAAHDSHDINPPHT